MPNAANDSSAPPVQPRAPQVLAGWKKLLALFAGLIVRAWTASLRIRISEPALRLISETSQPAVFVLWHNRVFVASALSRRFRAHRPLHCLISTSKDGAWLTAFFATVGLRAVRGSSSRGGREAAAELVRVLREGHHVGITPDGPRGPIYVCKPGALVIARRAGVRVVVLGINYQSAWRLRSWDRLQLPRPFSRVSLTLREFSVAELESDDALARLQSALRELNPETP